MKILLLGGHGFIGRSVAARLRGAGHRVLAPGRRELDLARMSQAQHWVPWLEGIEVVVNAAGILRPRGNDSFETIHCRAPLALAGACVDRQVKGFVQISALGNDTDGEFIASKHRFDAELLRLPLPAIVLRPSVVYASAGSYGGTSLLRALAAFPAVLGLPGDGQQQIQPIDLASLSEGVLRAVERIQQGHGDDAAIELVGPDVLSLADYLRAWRRWLGYPTLIELKVPLPLIGLASLLGEWWGSGALGRTIWGMLQRGNVAATDAWQRQGERLGLSPPPLERVLDLHPAQLQDRWQARLWLLAPLLNLMLALLWIGSGITGLSLDLATVERMSAPLGLSGGSAMLAAHLTSGLDLLLGGALLLGRRKRPVLLLMLASTLGYTLLLGLAAPALWLDPFGALLKNLPLVPALLIAWVLADRR
ncbi:DoxX-like family protein [Pseudomarimonas arenosa]|uniref:Sugar nucleotide-binding protein n=1 Tax=Pseudomarimonas arenosa TaxID=2774145 RepID=A0AAW3ZPB8_9GAMM|nr:DoxX-like family protein [Pseudomarimonas arenosa]MBD8526765.1 sugar nucleotide-binding protein [Pseudomarimonas arenosa]